MTNKERIRRAIESMDDDVTIEQAINHLYLLHKIDVGIQQADAGDWKEHEEFMRQLEAESEQDSL